ncbi:MAG TPA: c-type cytochrome [Planctomycetes bacterium]|nr:c-type cytochrome [Planctomycetota bacterium]
MVQSITRVLLFSCLYPAIAGFWVSASAGQRYLSPCSVVAGKTGDTLYIAEFDAQQIAVYDVTGCKVSSVISLAGGPVDLAACPDRSRLYVTLGGSAGKVCEIDLNTQEVVGCAGVGHTPGGVVISPDCKSLYVCNQFDNNVSVVDISAHKEVSRIPVLREPVAAAVRPDGKFLYVANFLPAGAADGGYTAAVVSVIDTTANKVINNIQLPNGSTGLRGICVSADGRYVYATHILGRYQMPTTQLERGWMNTNALSVIDSSGQKLVNTVLLDDIDLGAANPWGVACTQDGKYICVTHSGSHELSVIDRKGLHDKLAKAARGQVSSPSQSALSYPSDVPNDLAFLVGFRRRIKLGGNGPRGLAVVGTKVFAAEYFSDSLGVVEINPEKLPDVKSIPLGPEKKMTVERKGEMLFHNASMCFQQWQSCASCHPGQARSDAMNWDLLNDGMGNPRNSKSLLLSHKTPPVMITGVRDRAETAVRSGIKYIQFVVRPDDDAVAMDEYLKSLEPVQSPYLKGGGLSESAKRGKDIFDEAGCARCHPAPLYTDLKKYDVGTGKGRDTGRKFDTPTLVEVWRTGPYLYDGRAVTIKEVLTKYNPADKHGKTSALNEQQINDLVEFVLSQ